jgi:glycosyltransferase involved in cell wall biosynthesis
LSFEFLYLGYNEWREINNIHNNSINKSEVSGQMKILIINWGENSCPGGINKTVRETAKNLSLMGHQVFLLQDNPYNMPERECIDGYEVIRISTLSKYLYGFNPEILFKFKKLIQTLSPQIIHTHGYHNLLSLEIVSLVRNNNFTIPVVFSPHLDVYKSTLAGKYLWNVYNLLGKSIFKNVDHIISPSNFEAENIKSSYGVKEVDISIIPHGINLIDNQKKIYHQNETCKLLYAGYLVDRKGVNHIIFSLNHLVNELNFKDVKLTIIGDGPEKSKLKKLCKNFNLDKYVVWQSFLEDEEYINEIKDSNIFLLLSNSEAYGITVAEALALGTPCIVSKKTALKEFLNEPGCFGVDYPPNPEEVAELVLEIINNNEQVGPFSDKIRTWYKVATDYEKVYQTLIKREES